MQLRKNRYKVLLNRARGCIKEFDDACFLSDRCRHLIRFKNKLGEFCTKLACSQERALKHASEFDLGNFIPWKIMLCTDWRLTWKNPVDLESRVWLEKRCYFPTPQFQKTIYHCTFRFWHMTIFERTLTLGFGSSFYNIKMLPFLSFYPLIDSENKVAPSRAKFYTTIQKGREDGRRLTYKISLAAVQYYHPLQSSTYKNRTCHHQLGRRQLATKATHLCQRQRQLYVFPLPVTIFQHMFKSGDSLAETSWITTSIGFRVYAEDHHWMEASFGSHWQLTQIFSSCCSTPFTLASKGLCNSSWWSWTISFDLILSSAIFSRCPHAIPGTIRNFLNNYPFLLMKRKFVFNRLFLLAWLERIHGAFAKKQPCRMDLSFWNGKRLAKRSDSD